MAGLQPGQIAEKIHDECGPAAGTSWIRAYRLAMGISLADVVAQVRAWYVSEGRTVPRFSETLLSAYESGQKRPGPEYLHYLCAVYRADPPGLGYPDPCFCGRGHGEERQARRRGRARRPSARHARLSRGRPRPGQPRGPGLRVPGKLAPRLVSGHIADGHLPAGAAPLSLVLADAGPRTMTTWSAGCCCG